MVGGAEEEYRVGPSVIEAAKTLVPRYIAIVSFAIVASPSYKSLTWGCAGRLQVLDTYLRMCRMVIRNTFQFADGTTISLRTIHHHEAALRRS